MFRSAFALSDLALAADTSRGQPPLAARNQIKGNNDLLLSAGAAGVAAVIVNGVLGNSELVKKERSKRMWRSEARRQNTRCEATIRTMVVKSG